METVSRFLPIPRQSFFLFGPRGTGKATWLRQQFPDALFVDLLKEDVFRSMSARPERLKELVLGAPDKAVVVVDEVQRVPEVLNVVHELIERPSDVLFVLTGSSARKLRRGGVDLLAGRALNRSLHPFMAAEYAAFELDRALELGLVPFIPSFSPAGRRRIGVTRPGRNNVLASSVQHGTSTLPPAPSEDRIS